MLEKIKKAWKSWTMNTAFLISAFGVVQSNIDVLGLTQKQHGLLLIGLGVIMAGLRMKTDKPLEDR